jgi:hypothetical protein
MKRLGAALLLTATLAFAAAGCGGSDPSATEEWAGDVCSSVGDWQDQLEQSASDIREQIRSPSADTLAAVQSEIEEAVDASRELTDDLRSLDAPDTESGEEAQQEIAALADLVETTIDKTQETIDNLPKNAGLRDVAQAVAPLLPSLQALVTNVSSTLSSVQERGSELKESFDDADACERYR